MSELVDAFDDMLDAQEEAMGERVTCRIGKKTVEFLADDAGTFEAFVEGGNAEDGTIEGKVRAADFPKGIKKFEAFEYRGQTLQILNARPVNKTLHITAGDPVADE